MASFSLATVRRALAAVEAIHRDTGEPVSTRALRAAMGVSEHTAYHVVRMLLDEGLARKVLVSQPAGQKGRSYAAYLPSGVNCEQFSLPRVSELDQAVLALARRTAPEPIRAIDVGRECAVGYLRAKNKLEHLANAGLLVEIDVGPSPDGRARKIYFAAPTESESESESESDASAR